MKKNKQLQNSQIAEFCNQMTLILHAGISSYEGIALMCDDVESQELLPTLNIVKDHLEKGQSFYEALKASQSFPGYYLDMIHICEKAGRLEDVLKSLGIHYQRLYENNESIKNAISYPMIMIAMMLLVVLVLITQVLPIFNRVFEQLGSSLTGFSQMVLNIGNVLSSYSYLFIGILIVCCGLYFYFTRNESGKVRLYQFMTRCRLTRQISLKMALSQFTSGLSISLSSGLDIDESMVMAKRLVEHKNLLKKIEHAQELMETTDMASSLCESQILTGMYAKLVKIGNKTGSIDGILQDISDRYDNETSERIAHLISIIEPTLVAVLSVMVGLILLSIMMPLIGIMSSL